jgi:hypothetical protein
LDDKTRVPVLHVYGHCAARAASMQSRTTLVHPVSSKAHDRFHVTGDALDTTSEAAFRDDLRTNGWEEARNLAIERRYAQLEFRMDTHTLEFNGLCRTCQGEAMPLADSPAA